MRSHSKYKKVITTFTKIAVFPGYRLQVKTEWRGRWALLFIFYYQAFTQSAHDSNFFNKTPQHRDIVQQRGHAAQKAILQLYHSSDTYLWIYHQRWKLLLILICYSKIIIDVFQNYIALRSHTKSSELKQILTVYVFQHPDFILLIPGSSKSCKISIQVTLKFLSIKSSFQIS